MYLHILLVLSGLASVWLQWRFKNRRLLKMAAKIPGPPALPLLGNALYFMVDSEEMLKTIELLMSKYGDHLKFWLGPDLNIVVKNPDDLKILLGSPKTTAKGPQYKYMADMLGGGILSGSGPTWRKHRKLANPNYGKHAVESYSTVFNEEAEVLLKELMQTTKEINVYDYVVIATSFAVCRTLMGLTKQETLTLPHFYRVIKEGPSLYNVVFERMTKWYLQVDPVFWMTKYHKQQKEFAKIMAEFCNAIILQRVEKLEKQESIQEDLLNVDKDSVDSTKLSVVDRFILSKELDDNEMVEETFTIFTSSQEASAKIASYFILMMAFHPDCQQKLYSEILEVVGEEDRPISGEDFRRMPYLEMVYKEVVRLFPIGAMLQRTVLEDVEIRRHFGTSLVKTICVRLLKNFEVSSSQTYKDLRIIIAISVKSISGYPVTLRPRNKGMKIQNRS